MNFEEKLSELENIVSKLEKGNLSLDETITLFENGISAAKQCQKLLDDAEKRVLVVSSNKDGEDTLDEFADIER